MPLTPRAAISVLVLLCASIAVVSVASTDDEPGGGGPALVRGLDKSQVTELHPRGALPSLDEPRFEAIADADWLKAREPVVAVELDGDARAYPIQILTWHEVVNDRVGDQPLAITYCPLCSSALVFRRPEFSGRTTSFVASGDLYRSNLLLYDRVARSLWQQLTGIAVSGERSGATLLRVPAPVVSWRDFRASFPEGSVLSRDTGFDRPYGRNPYPGFDTDDTPSVDITVELDDRLDPMERVLGVRTGDKVIAYPFSFLRRRAGRDGVAIVNDTVGGEPIVVIWRAGMVSALDQSSIVDSRDVGSAVVYGRNIEGEPARFRSKAGGIVDPATRTTWDVFGRATGGRLEGSRLKSIDAIEAFWFNWAEFHPRTQIWSRAGGE